MFSILTRPFTGPIGFAMWTKAMLTKSIDPGSIPVKLRFCFLKICFAFFWTKRLARAFRYSHDFKHS